MKRILDGKTYNTETATMLAKAEQDGGHLHDTLYQTRHGAYFRHHGDWSYGGPHEEMLEDIEPLSPAQAQSWMEKHRFAHLIERHFGPQPEAGEAESRVTVRIPDSLKSRIEALASARGQSLNAWIMRCLESCADAQAHGR
ncbi:toxin-antitoxin system HicB family antitoxin [Methylobacterium sp. CCH5-D2]|uniref:toxin-antitoxin system HicB family antitoxin n=1 Tax=Methylobacterium sp. CCH5-D2 TaxID=1768765 RepID=UPI00082C79D2|nr:toxin-antitoxin system HicB family antitoxin [Methylobacterium sp. CCH5-D2]